MNYSWRAFKSVTKQKLRQGPYRLRDDNGMLQPPANDELAFPEIVPGFLEAEQCEKIIEFSNNLALHDSKVGTGEGSDYRKSDVSWVFPSQETNWIFDHIERAVKAANKKYKFELFGFFQGGQIARYGQEGHFDWHSDVGPGSSSHRKLSVSILLNDPEEYGGGALEFMSVKGKVNQDRGTAIIFPSYLVHRVAPVTEGCRISLVSWISGPPFR